MVKSAAFVLALLLTALVADCSEPLLLLPGGALEGATVPTPEGWSFTDDVDTVQLETNPTDPYSVNIWVIAPGDPLEQLPQPAIAKIRGYCLAAGLEVPLGCDLLT
jgi:hypothetical protein